jgi:FMN phosphatase YigB (HAD superfamily)
MTDPLRDVSVVVFDVGETLVDETGLWMRAAAAIGVPPFTLMGVIGGLAARGERHDRAWEILGVPRPASTGVWLEEFYPDALPCLARLRELGYRIGAVGNTPVEAEEILRPYVDFVGSSERWGVAKPSAAFFARVAKEAGQASERVVYVGDRIDNDIVPALEAGMTAIHVRRGPWGFFHDAPPGDVT